MNSLFRISDLAQIREFDRLTAKPNCQTQRLLLKSIPAFVGQTGINSLLGASSLESSEVILHPRASGFESAVMEHLDAANNLARWLLRNEQDAEDVVQESCIKAMRAFDSFRGGDFRAWFLAIVRNTSFSWLRRNRSSLGSAAAMNLEDSAEPAADSQVYDPQAIAIRAADAELVRRAIAALPVVLRETLVLREMEQLSYKEIGKITDVPIGTVMSRLARGRKQLQALLMADEQPSPEAAQEGTP
jgi:RNA polymerase sigma-70 factor, ECF subfamily